MKAVLLTGIKNLEIRDLPDPVPLAGQAVVAVKACGICGSDVHFYKQGRIGADNCVFPQALGHEPAGMVEKTLPGSKFKSGDRVAIEPALPCYACEHCAAGHFNRCPNVKFFASPGMQGAFSERVVVDERQLALIPDTISFDEAAILEPLGVAYHSVKMAGIKKGETVAVMGSGAIGLLTLAMAKLNGAGETFIVDRLKYRLDFAAEKFGADHVIEATSVDPVEYIRSKTKGRGVDVSFEAAGEQKTFDYTFESARIGGRCFIIGIPEVDTIAINPHIARRRELLVRNVRRSNQALEPCINLLKSGALKVDVLATHHFSLDQIQQAFDVVETYQDNVIRAIIRI